MNQAKPHHKAMQPLKGDDQIAAVRAVVETSPRDYALFVLGTNTAFRAADILGLNVGDVRYLNVGDELVIKERKTAKRSKPGRMVNVNAKVVEALQRLIATLEDASDDAPLFVGEKRKTRLTVNTFSRLVKGWCEQAGLRGDFAAHSLRKTFGYTLRTKHGYSVDALQQAYGHSSGAITLRYVCIQPEELKAMYMLGV